MNVYRHKASQYWQIEFQVDGVTYCASAKTTSKPEAVAKAQRWKKEVLSRRAACPSLELPDMTFDEAAARYWDERGQFTRSARALDGDLARTVQMVGADKMCSTITRDDIRTIRTALLKGERPGGIGETGRRLKEKGRYQPKTINRYIGLIGTVLNWVGVIPLYRRGTQQDPRDTGREIARPRYRWLSFEEQFRLEKVMDRDLKDLVRFAIDTGIREEQLCLLAWAAIDWALCTVTIPLKSKGNDENMHTIDLTPEAMKILYARRALHAREGVRSNRVFLLRARRTHWHRGRNRKSGELIELTPHLFYRRFTDACGRAGIEDIVVHDLRRTAGRRIYDEEGSDIEAARALLGHADIKTTQDYLGVTGTAINRHLRRRSARTKLVMAEFEAAAKRTDAVPGSREYALHDVLSQPLGSAHPSRRYGRATT